MGHVSALAGLFTCHLHHASCCKNCAFARHSEGLPGRTECEAEPYILRGLEARHDPCRGAARIPTSLAANLWDPTSHASFPLDSLAFLCARPQHRLPGFCLQAPRPCDWRDLFGAWTAKPSHNCIADGSLSLWRGPSWAVLQHPPQYPPLCGHLHFIGDASERRVLRPTVVWRKHGIPL